MKILVVIITLFCTSQVLSNGKLIDLPTPEGEFENQNEYVVVQVKNAQVFVHMDTVSKLFDSKIQSIPDSNKSSYYYGLKEQIRADYLIKGDVNRSFRRWVVDYEDQKTSLNPFCVMMELLSLQKAYLYFQGSFMSSVYYESKKSKITAKSPKGKLLCKVKNCG